MCIVENGNENMVRLSSFEMIATMPLYIGYGNGYDIDKIILLNGSYPLQCFFNIISTRLLEGISTCCFRVMSCLRGGHVPIWILSRLEIDGIACLLMVTHWNNNTPLIVNHKFIGHVVETHGQSNT